MKVTIEFRLAVLMLVELKSINHQLHCKHCWPTSRNRDKPTWEMILSTCSTCKFTMSMYIRHFRYSKIHIANKRFHQMINIHKIESIFMLRVLNYALGSILTLLNSNAIAHFTIILSMCMSYQGEWVRWRMFKDDLKQKRISPSNDKIISRRIQCISSIRWVTIKVTHV